MDWSEQAWWALDGQVDLEADPSPSILGFLSRQGVNSMHVYADADFKWDQIVLQLKAVYISNWRVYMYDRAPAKLQAAQSAHLLCSSSTSRETRCKGMSIDALRWKVTGLRRPPPDPGPPRDLQATRTAPTTLCCALRSLFGTCT